jgi:hypothetical protein
MEHDHLTRVQEVAPALAFPPRLAAAVAGAPCQELFEGVDARAVTVTPVDLEPVTPDETY